MAETTASKASKAKAAEADKKPESNAAESLVENADQYQSDPQVEPTSEESEESEAPYVHVPEVSYVTLSED